MNKCKVCHDHHRIVFGEGDGFICIVCEIKRAGGKLGKCIICTRDKQFVFTKDNGEITCFDCWSGRPKDTALMLEKDGVYEVCTSPKKKQCSSCHDSFQILFKCDELGFCRDCFDIKRGIKFRCTKCEKLKDMPSYKWLNREICGACYGFARDTMGLEKSQQKTNIEKAIEAVKRAEDFVIIPPNMPLRDGDGHCWICKRNNQKLFSNKDIKRVCEDCVKAAVINVPKNTICIRCSDGEGVLATKIGVMCKECFHETTDFIDRVESKKSDRRNDREFLALKNDIVLMMCNAGVRKWRIVKFTLEEEIKIYERLSIACYKARKYLLGEKSNTSSVQPKDPSRCLAHNRKKTKMSKEEGMVCDACVDYFTAAGTPLTIIDDKKGKSWTEIGWDEDGVYHGPEVDVDWENEGGASANTIKLDPEACSVCKKMPDAHWHWGEIKGKKYCAECRDKQDNTNDSSSVENEDTMRSKVDCSGLTTITCSSCKNRIADVYIKHKAYCYRCAGYCDECKKYAGLRFTIAGGKEMCEKCYYSRPESKSRDSQSHNVHVCQGCNKTKSIYASVSTSTGAKEYCQDCYIAYKNRTFNKNNPPDKNILLDEGSGI